MMSLFYALGQFCSSVIAPLVNLATRIYMGYFIFFVSGLAKLEDMETTIEDFQEDFAVPLLPPELAAYMATAGELVLPVLLILGLFTRFAAMGLLIMTMVIQFFVLPLDFHYVWMCALGLIVGYGGDKISLDHLMFRKS